MPTGTDWIHEYKYDGYRLLIATGGGAATAWTRNGNDWSDKFRALVKAAADLPAGCLIDGEAVALDKNGKPDFQLLQATLEGRRRRPRLLRLRPAGRPGRGHHASCPTSSARSGSRRCSRRSAAPILYGDHVIGKGEALFDAICKEGGEGIISKKAKRALSRRAHAELAQDQMHPAPGIRHRRLAGKRQAPRLPLAATSPCATGGKLTYAGKVGTGFNTAMIEEPERADAAAGGRQAAARSAARRRARRRTGSSPSWSPRSPSPNSPRDGMLRHPSFIALREDKPAKEVVREVPEASRQGGEEGRARRPPTSFGIKISNPDRVIFPGDELTKGDSPIIMPRSTR